MAIVSGRSLKKLYEFVQLDDVYYAGSHGFEIMGPPRHASSHQPSSSSDESIYYCPAKEYLPMLRGASRILV